MGLLAGCCKLLPPRQDAILPLFADTTLYYELILGIR